MLCSVSGKPCGDIYSQGKYEGKSNLQVNCKNPLLIFEHIILHFQIHKNK